MKKSQKIGALLAWITLGIAGIVVGAGLLNLVQLNIFKELFLYGVCGVGGGINALYWSGVGIVKAVTNYKKSKIVKAENDLTNQDLKTEKFVNVISAQNQATLINTVKKCVFFKRNSPFVRTIPFFEATENETENYKKYKDCEYNLYTAKQKGKEKAINLAQNKFNDCQDVMKTFAENQYSKPVHLKTDKGYLTNDKTFCALSSPTSKQNFIKQFSNEEPTTGKENIAQVKCSNNAKSLMVSVSQPKNLENAVKILFEDLKTLPQNAFPVTVTLLNGKLKNINEIKILKQEKIDLIYNEIFKEEKKGMENK
ncbi:MAG: hypothetical protein RR140_02055 [Clostridia bacterium]